MKKFITEFFAKGSDLKMRGGIFIPILIIGAIAAVTAITASGGLGAAAQGVAADLYNAIMRGLGNFVMWSTGGIFALSGEFFRYVTSSQFVTATITGNPTYRAAWGMVRDLANMMIVLGFVLVGIATTLRLREYEAQKTLFPLIIVAILINFSPLFCGLVIDAANILMGYFSSAGAGDLPKFLTENLTKGIKESTVLVGTGPEAFLAYSAVCGAAFLIAAVSFFMMSVLLSARVGVLAVLFVLSPLALFCIVFKGTQHVWKTWSENFIKWSFMGVACIFFVYLAGGVVAKAAVSNTLGINEVLTAVIFLIVGFKMAIGSSAQGASAIIAGATGVAGFAAGRVLGAAGKMASTAKQMGSNTRLGHAVQDRMSSLRESVGLAPAGTTAQNQDKRLGEAKKRMEALRQRDPNSFRNIANRDKGVNGAAAMAVAAEKGDLYNLDRSKLATRMARAKGFGVDRSVFEKADPNLAGLSEKGTPHPPAEAYNKVRIRVRSMSKKDVQSMSRDALTPQVLSSMSPDQFKSLTVAQKDEVRKKYAKGGERREEAKAHSAMLRSAGNAEDRQNMAKNILAASSSGNTVSRPPRPTPAPVTLPPPPPPRRPSSAGYTPVTPPASGAGSYRVRPNRAPRPTRRTPPPPPPPTPSSGTP